MSRRGESGPPGFDVEDIRSRSPHNQRRDHTPRSACGTWQSCRTAVFSSIESNAFDDYEMYLGTKGTLIMLREREALLFQEGGSGRQTGIEVTAAGKGAAAQSSETMTANTNQGATRAAAPSAAGDSAARPSATRLQMRRFCSAIRVGTPLARGPDKAIGSARACIGANEAIKTRARVDLPTT